MRALSYILLLLSITGCYLLPVKTEYVEIPTPSTCVTWEPERAPRTLDILEREAPLWGQLKALLVDRENDQHFIEGQEAVIAGCK